MTATTINYRLCSDNTVRVWREGWSSDMFEVMTLEYWNTAKQLLNRLSFLLIEHVDD